MKKEYLSEAFRQLELLNEEDFNLSTTADNSDLKDFLDNDDMSVMSLDVIDPEAETEEDLEDSYTGKVILDCCVCHSKLYKDKEEVQLDEEQDLANTDEECPFCYSRDGFKIIGEVAPYGETEEETEGAEDDKSLKLDSEKETEIDESIRKGLELKEGFMGQTLDDFLGDWNNAENISIWCYDENEDGPVFEGDVSDIPDKYLNAQFDDFDTEGKIYVNISDVDEDFDESLKTRKNRKLKESLKGAHAKLIADEDEIRDYLSDDDTRDLRTALKHLGDTGRVVDDSIHVTVRFSGGDRITLPKMFFEFDMDESLKTRRNKSVNESEEGKKLFTEYKILVDGKTYEISHTKQRADEIVPILKDMYPDSEIEAKPYKHYASGVERKRLERQIADQLKEYGVNESVNESNHKPGFENMSMKDLYYYYRDNIDQDEYPTFLHWAETIITPANSQNNEIEKSLDDIMTPAEAKEYWEKEHDYDPVLSEYDSFSDWYKDSVANGYIKESIENATIDTENETITMTSKEDGGVSVETSPKECCENDEVLVPLEPETEHQIENNSSDEIDVPIDEFDEETFDELGESFLKNTYENVNGYKTESIKEQDGNKLVIEGLITFNSGKVKKTSFIFEAKDITKSGKVRFIGENCQLSRGKKSFTVAGKVQEGKFISESLNYNYRAKDAKSGKSTRMYGTVRTNK